MDMVGMHRVNMSRVAKVATKHQEMNFILCNILEISWGGDRP